MEIKNDASLISKFFSSTTKNELNKKTQENLVNQIKNLKNIENITLTNEENLKLLLLTANIPLSEKNTSLLKLLLNNSIPFNKENFQTSLKNLKLFDTLPMEKLEVLLKNDIIPNNENAKQLEGYISKEISLKTQIKQLFSDIDNEEDLQNIVKIFTKQNSLANLSKETFDILNNIKSQLISTLNKNPELSEKLLNIFQNIYNSSQQKPTNQDIKPDNIENFLFTKNQNNIENNIKNLLPSKILTTLKNSTNTENIKPQSNKSNLNNTKDTVQLEQFIKNMNLENYKNIFKIISSKKTTTSSDKLEFINNFAEEIVSNILPNKILFDEDFLMLFKNTLKQTFSVNKEDLNTYPILEKELFKILFKETFKEMGLSELKNFINKTSDFQNKLNLKTSFDFENSDSKDLNLFLSNMKENLILSKNIVKDSDTLFDKNIENINKNIDFMSALKDTTFIQIPLNINNQQTNTELFVFKDKKSKSKKNINSGSVLLSLNLKNLGLVEAYINKIESDIYCQFRIKNKDIKNLIKENSELLKIFLKEKKLSLKELTFKEIEESFSLISKELSDISDDKLLVFESFDAKA